MAVRFWPVHVPLPDCGPRLSPQSNRGPLLARGAITRLAIVVAEVPAAIAPTNPASAKPAASMPAANSPCGDRFSVAGYRERVGCRWIAAHKRAEGTYATAYC